MCAKMCRTLARQQKNRSQRADGHIAVQLRSTVCGRRRRRRSGRRRGGVTVSEGVGVGMGNFRGSGARAGLIAYRPPPAPSSDVTASGREKSHQPETRVKSMSGATSVPTLPRAIFPFVHHPRDQKRLRGQKEFGVQKRHQKKKKGPARWFNRRTSPWKHFSLLSGADRPYSGLCRQ